MATVDGTLHAVDRSTGDHRWTFRSAGDLVDTTFAQNHSTGDDVFLGHDYVYIVEPHADGNLFVFHPNSGLGVQKLPFTVKQLVEDLSPYYSDDPPMVFTAEKKNRLYTVNANDGTLIREFSSGGSSFMVPGSCPPARGLDMNDECDPISILTLGQTEYMVDIRHAITGESICALKYREWSPNNRDSDLQRQYTKSLDNKYVYSRYDGGVYALENKDNEKKPPRLVFNKKFSSPVARVYDVARPFEASEGDTSLIILPQPLIGQFPDTSSEDSTHNIFVNRTESGSLYALSELMYPYVTDGASRAKCYDRQLDDEYAMWNTKLAEPTIMELVGVHSVADEPPRSSFHTISPPVDPPARGIDDGTDTGRLLPEIDAPKTSDYHYTLLIISLSVVILFLCKSFIPNSFKPVWKSSLVVEHKPTLSTDESSREEKEESAEPEAEVQRKAVRFVVPDDAENEQAAMTAAEETGNAPADADPPLGDQPANPLTPAEQGQEADTPQKKKKAHRGRRGGRKAREANKINAIVNGVGGDGAFEAHADIKAVEGASSSDPSSSDEINGLRIMRDRVIGHGSGGTVVFEGEYQVSPSSKYLSTQLLIFFRVSLWQ